MPGLLARARLVRQRSAGEAGEDGPASDEAGVSAEKKQEIRAQMERMVARVRTPVPASAFQVRAPKRGILLPLVANALLALLAGAVIFFAARYFRVRQESLSLASASYLSTEGRLVDAIRRESEQKLEQKDAEIAGIQERLDLLDKESESLRATMDGRVREREAKLREEMQAVLEAERTRLQGQGVTSADVEQRVAQISEQKAREQAKELESYRVALEAESRDREAVIQGEREKAVESLRKADMERLLLAEARKGAEEAQAGFDSERQSLRDEISIVERKLRELEATQQREQAVADQILASYARVIEEVTLERYEEARQDLLKFRRYLADPAFEALPSIARRRQVDLFLIAALQAIVAPEYFDAFRSRGVLQAIEQSVRQAEEKLKAGEAEEARKLYGEALGMVASVELAAAAIQEIDAEERETLLRASVERSRSEEETADPAAAVEGYRRMLDLLPERDRELLSEALSALERAFADRQASTLAEKQSAFAEERGELEQRIAGLESDLAARDADVHAARAAARAASEAAAAAEDRGRASAAAAEEARAAQADALSAAGVAAAADAREEASLERAEAASRDLAARLQSLSRIAATATAASSSYQAGAATARTLLSGERPDPEGAGAALGTALSGEAASTLFPGLAEVLELLSRSIEGTARSAGYAAGYQAAADDVVDYTAYVSGAETEAPEAARSRLLSRVESEPAFRSAVGGIEELVGKAESSPLLSRSVSRLLGPVASVVRGRVVIEDLGTTSVTAGARVELRRSEADGTEATVARGTVESAQGRRVVVGLEGSADGSFAAVRLSDLAYVVVGE